MVNVKLQGLTSDVASYYYMLGEDVFNEYGLEEVTSLLQDKTNSKGLTEEDRQQLWEVCVDFLYPQHRILHLFRMFGSILSLELGGVTREWSPEHTKFNIEFIYWLVEKAKNENIDTSKDSGKLRYKGTVGVANKAIEKVYYWGYKKLAGKEFLVGAWKDLRLAYKKYQEVTGKVLYVCIREDDELKSRPYIEIKDMKHTLTPEANFLYRWGDGYALKVFYSLGDVLDEYEKQKTKNLLNRCHFGLSEYIKLIK